MAQHRSKPHAGKRAGRRWVPGLLPLEDRTVPSTFYVDPAFGSQPGPTFTFNANYPGTVTGITAADAFTDLRAAIDAANTNPGADTIKIAQSTTPITVDNAGVPDDPDTGNAIKITESLALDGSGVGATVLAPNSDTTFGKAPDSLTSVFRVAGAGVTFTASDLSFDGAGKQLGVGFQVRDGATATFTRVNIQNVVFTPTGATDGVALLGFAAGRLDVVDSTIQGYGRTGILYQGNFTVGSGTPGAITGSKIIGRGAGDLINNGIEVTDASQVLVTGSTIQGNNGHDGGSASSGVLAYTGVDTSTTPPTVDGSPTVTLVGNTISGNAIGLNVGQGAGDKAVVNAQFNNIAGNNVGADGSASAVGINAPNNWWGDATGPFNAASNPNGLGNPVTANVTFQPFLTGPTAVRNAETPAGYQAAVAGVTISPLPGQANPVASGTVRFAVHFDQAVTGFDNTDLTVIPTTGGTPTVQVAGSGADYVVTVSGLTGTGNVSAAVNAGAATTTNGVSTTASNTATADYAVPNPTISDVPNQTVAAGDSVTLPFSVADTDVPASSLTVTATSSNPALTPTLTLSGTGQQRFVTVGTAAGQTGTARVTLTVSDGRGGTATDTFDVTVVPQPNNPPTISGITNQTVQAGNSAGPLAFSVFDDKTAATALTVTATSSNPALTPTLTLAGTGSQRFITVGTAGGAGGTATITVTVTDEQGLHTASTFTVTATKLPPVHLTAVGADAGGGPEVRVYNSDGTQRFAIFAFESTFTGGVRVAVGDVNGDGVDDIIVGAGVGGAPLVRVYNGEDGSLLFNFFAYEPSLRSGVNVAAGDIDGDGKAEIIAGAGDGGAPAVAVFNGDGTERYRFFAFESSLRGGVTVAAGDVDGDGKAEIMAGAGFGGAPAIAVFNGADGTERYRFFAYDSSFRNGVYVSAGDLDGDGKAEIVAGAGPGGGPQVRVVHGDDGSDIGSFFAYDPSVRSGVRVATGEVTGGGSREIITGPGPGVGPNVRGFDLSADGTFPNVYSVFPFFPSFTGGVYVG
jgi:hypothetical protein